MNDEPPPPLRSTAADSGGAFPFTGPAPGRGFLVHAVLALGGLVFLNWLIGSIAPQSVKQIGSSYLIMYYHVPAAIWTYLLFAASATCGVCFLVTKSGAWDRRGRAFGTVGLLANGVTLLTGSVWGKTAWNTWWVVDDPRLLSAAMLFLVWLGYVLLQHAAEDDDRRPRFAAVYSICALAIVPLVMYAPQWFGVASHPAAVAQKDDRMATTWAVSMIVFPVFYLLLYRWKFDRDTIAGRADDCLARLRRLEETPR